MIKNPLISQKEFDSAPHFLKISRPTINSMRLLAAQLISSGVKMLKMSHACYCTAQLLFQQFFAIESFLEHSLIDVVMAAVFVAGKVEECIRRARDIVNVFHQLYCLIRGLPAHPIDYVGDVYYVWRDRLCTAEAVLLRTLGFHVQPASPVPLLISYLQVLELPQLLPKLPQVAFSWLNDLLRTPVGVLYQPNVLSVCAIDLAAGELKFAFPAELVAEWFALFDVNGEELSGCKRMVLESMQGAEEIDFLLPLTKEELKIFASQIESDSDLEDGRSREDCRREDRSRDGRIRDDERGRDEKYPMQFRDRSHSTHSTHSAPSSNYRRSHSQSQYQSRSRSRSPGRPRSHSAYHPQQSSSHYYNKQHRN